MIDEPDVHARTTVGAAFVEPADLSHAQAVVQAQRADRARCTPPDLLAALTADVLTGMQVMNVRDHLGIPDELLAERSCNIVQGLWNNYRISALDVEEQTPLPALGAKGG